MPFMKWCEKTRRGLSWPRMGAVREKLEIWGKVAWVPVLAVASLGLVLSYCNYRLQTSGVRPKLIFTNGNVDEKTHFLRLYWHNSGKSIAWRGRGKLYNFGEGGKRSSQPLAEVDVEGVSQK